jgi:hypothetical protein
MNERAGARSPTAMIDFLCVTTVHLVFVFSYLAILFITVAFCIHLSLFDKHQPLDKWQLHRDDAQSFEFQQAGCSKLYFLLKSSMPDVR